MDMPKDSLERRILDYIQLHYPITVRELAKELHIQETKALHALKKMELHGIVELDVLPDRTFIRPMVLKGIANKTETKKEIGGGVDDPAYR
jgi:predicted ArsR family transcriptional regulator